MVVSKIPKYELEALARCFLPDIQSFFKTKEGQKEYKEWKAEQERLKAQRASSKP